MKVSEIKISYRSKVNLSEAPQIKCSDDAFQVAFHAWDKGEIEMREEFKLMLVNRANKVKGIVDISLGGTAGTVVDMKILFATILKSLSSSFIVFHNHPSGNIFPSQADKDLTNKIKKAAELFDLLLLDHIIVTPSGTYYSFADEGIL